MRKGSLLPALVVEQASNANKHAFVLRAQLRRNCEFIIDNNLRAIPRAKYLEAIDLVEELARKVLERPAFENLAEDLRSEWLATHYFITNASITPRKTLVKHDTAQLQAVPAGAKGATIADNYRFLVKVPDKGSVERFKGMEPQKILQEVNMAIKEDANVPKDPPGKLAQPSYPEGTWVLLLKHLRSRDFELHTGKVEDVEILRRSSEWVKVFGVAAKVFEDTYGVLVYFIRPKSMTLGSPSKDAKIARQIDAHNAQKISLLNRPEAIKVIGWLRKDRHEQTNTSIKIEFDLPELANEVIRKGLNWDGQPYPVEQYIHNGNSRQCYNCQAYRHNGNRYLANTKCAKCARAHNTNRCSSNTYRCANCIGPHQARSSHCRVRAADQERASKVINKASPYWPVKPPPTKPALPIDTIKALSLLLPTSPQTAAHDKNGNHYCSTKQNAYYRFYHSYHTSKTSKRYSYTPRTARNYKECSAKFTGNELSNVNPH